MVRYIFYAVVVGVIIGIILSYQFRKEKFITKTVTEIKTDTIYVELRDTIRLTKTEIHQEYIRDTVLINFKPQIKAFTTSKPFLYGNTRIKGEVLGEVLKMDIYNDLKIPTVTNTITNTRTIIKNPNGLYFGKIVGSNLGIGISVDFIRNKTVFSYNNDYRNKIHYVGIKRKIL